MLNIATAHANMISLFIFRFWIVSQMFLNLNFKTSSNMQMLYSLVCVEDKYIIIKQYNTTKSMFSFILFSYKDFKKYIILAAP